MVVSIFITLIVTHYCILITILWIDNNSTNMYMHIIHIHNIVEKSFIFITGNIKINDRY